MRPPLRRPSAPMMNDLKRTVTDQVEALRARWRAWQWRRRHEIVGQEDPYGPRGAGLGRRVQNAAAGLGFLVIFVVLGVFAIFLLALLLLVALVRGLLGASPRPPRTRF